MKTITLPDELNPQNSSSVQLFDYNSSKEISRQQIILHKNTISFLIEGSKEVFINDTSVVIDCSEFLIMKSGNCLMTEKLSDTKHYRSLLFFFSNEILLNFIRKMPIEAKRTLKYNSVFSFHYDKFIRLFTKSLCDIPNLPENVQQRVLEAKFEEIMLYLMSIYGQGSIHSLIYNNNNNSIQKFVQIVEKNQLKRLTVKEFAFLCNMSISTFKRVFENYYSESPAKWFRNKRLEHAHYLLHHERKSSSEIYFELGYENLSSFIKAYKIKYGITPKQHHKNELLAHILLKFPIMVTLVF